MMQVISDFLLSVWLFSVTYDWFHVMINTFVFCVLLQFLLRMNLARAVLLSFSAHFFSFMTYTMVALGFFAYQITADYVPSEMTEASATSDMLVACLLVAIVYAILQSFFLVSMHITSWHSIWRLVLIAFLSNIITAFLSYLCIMLLIAPLL